MSVYDLQNDNKLNDLLESQKGKILRLVHKGDVHGAEVAFCIVHDFWETCQYDFAEVKNLLKGSSCEFCPKEGGGCSVCREDD